MYPDELILYMSVVSPMARLRSHRFTAFPEILLSAGILRASRVLDPPPLFVVEYPVAVFHHGK